MTPWVNGIGIGFRKEGAMIKIGFSFFNKSLGKTISPWIGILCMCLSGCTGSPKGPHTAAAGVEVPNSVAASIQNMILNPDFELADDSGTNVADWQGVSGSGFVWDPTESQGTGTHSIKLDNPYTDDKIVRQTDYIWINQWAPSPIHIEGWSKAQNVPPTATYQITVTLFYYNGTLESQYITFTKGTHDWEQQNMVLTPTQPVIRMVIELELQGTGTAWFDNIVVSDELNPPTNFPGPLNNVQFSVDNNLLVNGVPFFPNGIYNPIGFCYPTCSSPTCSSVISGEVVNFVPCAYEEHIQRIAGQGFNTIILAPTPTFRELKWRLDIAYKYGVYAIVHSNRGVNYNSSSIPQNYAVKRLVSLFKYHPALLSWTNYDEPDRCTLTQPPKDPSQISRPKELYNLVKTEDPKHLSYITTGEWPYLYPYCVCSGGPPPSCTSDGMTTEQSIRLIADVTDIIVPDLSAINYPYNMMPTVGDYIDMTKNVVGNSKQIWNLFQTWPLLKNNIFPNALQQRMLSYYAINHGAKGLMQYAYWIYQGVSQNEDWYIPTSAPELWNGFTSLNDEINNKIAPIIFSKKIPQGNRLILKPGPVGIDSYVQSPYPDTNEGNDPTLVSGVYQAIYDWTYRSLLQFDLSVIPSGNVITQALLRLYAYGGADPNGSIGYQVNNVYRITGSWDETVTWNTKPTYDPTIIDTVEYSINNALGWKSWNITPLAQKWYDGLVPNYGMLVKDNLEIMDITDEKVIVATGNIIQVQNAPLRYHPCYEPYPPGNWHIWLASDPNHQGTDYMYDVPCDGVNWTTGTIPIPSLPAGTEVLVSYETSYNSFKYFHSSDYMDNPDLRPGLEVTYAPDGYIDRPFPLIDNSRNVDSAVVSKEYGNRPYIFATNTRGVAETTKFNISPYSFGLIDVFLENRSLVMQNNSFQDTFNAWQTHLYKLIPSLFSARLDGSIDAVSSIGNGTGTFSRGDMNATYVNLSGKIVNVTSLDAPRFESGMNGQGILIERESTNYVKQSSFEADEYWTWVNTSPTPPYATDITLHGIQAVRFMNGDAQGYQDVTGLVQGTTYVVSAYVLTTSQTTCQPKVSVDDGTGNGSVSIVKTDGVPNLWERLVVPFVATSTGTARVRIQADSQVTTQPCGPVYFDAVQLELGTAVTSFIPTTTVSATRNGENLRYPCNGNVSNTEGTISLWFKPENSILPSELAFFHAGDNNNPLNRIDLVFNTTTFYFYMYDQNGALSSVSAGGGPFIQNQWYHLAATYKNLNSNLSNGSLDIYLNGNPIAHKEDVYIGYIDLYNSLFNIGSIYTWWQTNTIIDNVNIFDRALTGGEVVNLYNSGN